ncbi:MAG: stage II sporulation protein R [Clostridia bacterium]|nr:stage II sporulation protein R [Clostridia bacterium]
MEKNIRKNIELGVLFGLICAVMLSFARFDARCDELRNGVLRLHILANSDSEEDQALKLKVRDRILEVSSKSLSKANDINEAIDIAKTQIESITEEANKVITSEGYDYKVTANIEENFFSNRVYDDFTLPAGVYNSLTVRIGKAQGHNWWCVVFPGVCLPAAEKGELKKSVSRQSAKLAECAEGYKVRFKTVEIYEKIKNKMQKNKKST